ncbi:AAA family ATPase [Streptomyces sp. NPDC021224]|uniref:AAA family ATPase n=1 Tax=unclassified Streptomyces TaxID=2593676 RepID=UPI003799F384
MGGAPTRPWAYRPAQRAAPEARPARAGHREGFPGVHQTKRGNGTVPCQPARQRTPHEMESADMQHAVGAPQPGGGPTPPAVSVTGHFPLPAAAPVQAPVPDGNGSLGGAAHGPVAVLLIGAAGAGKTTIARHWADNRGAPTAHISLDDVREWVRAGFADPQAGWNEHSEAQYRLARRTCGFAARNFLANGVSCIIDDAVFPDRPAVGLGGWKRHVGPGLVPVVLLPGLDIVLTRNAERSGNRRLSDEEVARIHGRMAGWYGSGLPIIDNSHLDVEAAAAALDRVVLRSLQGPPTW